MTDPQYLPPVDAHVVEDSDGFAWHCPECNVETRTSREYATKRCDGCDRIMQRGEVERLGEPKDALDW